jgi:hypothetical protein
MPKFGCLMALLVVIGGWAGTLQAAILFTPGTVFVGGNGSNTSLFNITGGGAVTTAFATTGSSSEAGQLAWSADLSTMYMSIYGANKVVAITANGTVTDFATNLNGPTGLLMTSSGHLLVSAFNANDIFDITAGGNFSGAVPFATGLSSPRNLLQVAPGTIYVTDQGSGDVKNVAAGGNMASVTAFATGLSTPVDIVSFNGHIYVANLGTGSVLDITAGGSSPTVFASGLGFVGLTVDGNKLLADVLATNNVYNITAGGAFTSASPTFATIASGFTEESLLDTVPAAAPEPSTLSFALTGLLACGLVRRRSTTVVSRKN